MYNLHLVLIIVVVIEVNSELFTNDVKINPPNFAQLDGKVPLWKRFENSILPSNKLGTHNNGSIWSEYKTDFEWWEAEVSFRISKGGQNGADGLAFWYLDSKKNNSVNGSPDMSKGLEIFFKYDFDNNIHHIIAMTDDANEDAKTQKVAGCIKKDYRDSPTLLKAKIQLYKNVLTVYLNNRLEDYDEEYELCFQAYYPNITKYGYFGASAAFGELKGYYSVTEAFGPRVDF